MFEKGTQIVYVPGHGDRDNIEFPPCEAGFVTSTNNKFVFCRFWYPDLVTLRTKANSEPVSPDDLIIQDTVNQSNVDYVLENIDENYFYRGERFR